MYHYLAIRFGSVVLTVLGISVVVFLMVRLVPGDVVDVIVGQDAVTEEAKQEMRAFFGLDRPFYLQYASWISKVVRGDLGTAWRRGVPVSTLILDRLSVTAELTLFAAILSLGLGISLGVIAAIKADTWIDQFARALAMVSLSVPVFWQGTMLILVFSLVLHWIPSVRYVQPTENIGRNLLIIVLPAFALGTAYAGSIMRMTRSSMLEVLRQDYVRTARSKGLSDWIVLTRHAMKNAMIPVITIAGLQIGYLMGGAVVVEEVFTLPGLGRLVVTAIGERDYPVVQGVVLFVATAFVLSNFLTDLAYAWLDPRIKFSAE